ATPRTRIGLTGLGRLPSCGPDGAARSVVLSAVVTSPVSLPSEDRCKPESLFWLYAGAARARQARTAAVDYEPRHAQADRHTVGADRGARRSGMHRDAGDGVARHSGPRTREVARSARPAALHRAPENTSDGSARHS